MKKSIFILFILSLILLIGAEGCDKVDLSQISEEDINKIIICKEPYIRHGADCCLDSNKNKICDKDEGLVEEPTKSQIVSREEIDIRCVEVAIVQVCDNGIKVKNMGSFTITKLKVNSDDRIMILSPNQLSTNLNNINNGDIVIPFIKIEGKNVGCSSKAITLMGCQTMVVKKGDKVKVHYTGTLEDGTKFDSSEGKDPLEFTAGAGQMIKGFDEAVIGMEVGQEKEVKIPPEEAYGTSGSHPLAGKTLIFKIKLVSIG